MLVAFGPGLWLGEGSVVIAAAGFHYPTRMAVIRLSGGALLVLSPVQPTEALLASVRALGPVRHILAPTKLHNLYLGDWHAAFPDSLLHAAPGLRLRRTDLCFGADLTDQPHGDWAGEVDQVILRNRIADEVVFFHRPSGTALFTDLLQDFPAGWFSGWRALVAWADGMTGPKPSVPRKFRLAFSDRRALRDGLSEISRWPVRRVVMAHGTPVLTDAQPFLERAFAWARP